MRTDAFIALTMRAKLVNRWVLHPLARAYAVIEGVERQCPWKQESLISVHSGRVEVTTYVRYKGTKWNLGTGVATFDVPPGGTLRVLSTNGVMNQTPFTPRLA